MPKRGRPSSRSATRQSRVAQRASRHSSTPLSSIEEGAWDMPSQGPGDRTWSRQTSTLVRREGEATARVKPQKLIQGGRRTPNGVPKRRAELHARGLATRAASGNGC